MFAIFEPIYNLVEKGNLSVLKPQKAGRPDAVLALPNSLHIELSTFPPCKGKERVGIHLQLSPKDVTTASFLV